MDAKNVGYKIALVVACALVIVWWAFRGDEEATDQIRIGCLSPFSGNGAVYGESLKRGFEIALEELRNENPDFYRRISVIYEDDELNSVKGVSAIKKLIDADDVKMVVGPFTSDVALAVAPITESRRIILLIPTATNYKLRNAGTYVFRVCPSDDIQGRVLADFATGKLNYKKVGIIYMNTDYGVGLKESFSKEFSANGGLVAVEEAFDKDCTDARTQLVKIKDAGVPLVFMPSNYREAAVVVRQAKEMAITAQFLATDGTFEPNFLKLVSQAAEGMIVTTMAWDPSKGIAAQFSKKFEQRFGEKPGAYSALCYDALKVALKALEVKTLTGQELVKVMQNTSYGGATGETVFDQDGEVDKDFSIYKVSGGQFVLVE